MDEQWSKGRTVTRLATAGLAAVLLVLTGFALWAAFSTNRAARQADRLSRLSDAYQQARFAVAAEESLERKYRLEPGPEVRQRYQEAAAALLAALDGVRQRGDANDQALVAKVEAQHARYLDGIDRMFNAVDAGDTKRVLAIDGAETEPAFGAIEAQVNAAADAHHEQSLAGLHALRRTEATVLVATPIAFAAGLGLLAVFWVLMLGYQRRTQRQATDNAHQALHDALTGLPNRTLLRDRTNQAIRQADRELVSAALLLLDLERFKEVNDTLGHHYGDQLLVEVGQRLKAALRGVDTVARLGGDEFAVLLPRIETVEGAVWVARKLQAALAQPFLLEGLSLDVEASIGLALYPEHGDDSDELLQHADIAMYVAKETHAGFVLFQPSLDQHSPRRLALLGELRRGIDYQQLLLHYQPKVHAHTGQVLGVEALVRWQHPEHGLIPPNDFIPLAERTGLIGPLTHYVLDAALYQCRQWQQAGHELAIAVNVSARRLLDLHFPDEVAGLLASWGIPARLLVVEITESTIMADPPRALEILGRLNTMGVQLSIDDFGTGYSSMAYLKSLPVHELKIDRSFVMQMTSDTRDAVIVRSTVDLGRNLGLRVVAEGVEDQTTLQELDQLGCDAIQGYYISRPVPPDDLIHWLKQHQAATPTPPPTGAGVLGHPPTPAPVPALVRHQAATRQNTSATDD
ncbi:MAG TPA: EAL domain-containing protein [Actinomycetes bacterium]|nr:EAL domain-containing protein [Actinomycetes bacterium]